MHPAEARPAGRAKQQRRTVALAARRRAGPVPTGPALLLALTPLLAGAGTVASYASFGHEPETGALHAALLAAGVRVLLPVLHPDGDLGWAVYDGRLVPAPGGFPQPPGADLGRDALAAAQVVLVPALAVDLTGIRLGRGGGSYDRALPRATGLTVALLHDGELVASLPAEPHDVRVGAAVTPGGGVVHLPGGIAG